MHSEFDVEMDSNFKSNNPGELIKPLFYLELFIFAEFYDDVSKHSKNIIIIYAKL
jgi:hypothetical protein